MDEREHGAALVRQPGRLVALIIPDLLKAHLVFVLQLPFAGLRIDKRPHADRRRDHAAGHRHKPQLPTAQIDAAVLVEISSAGHDRQLFALWERHEAEVRRVSEGFVGEEAPREIYPPELPLVRERTGTEPGVGEQWVAWAPLDPLDSLRREAEEGGAVASSEGHELDNHVLVVVGGSGSDDEANVGRVDDRLVAVGEADGGGGERVADEEGRGVVAPRDELAGASRLVDGERATGAAIGGVDEEHAGGVSGEDVGESLGGDAVGGDARGHGDLGEARGRGEREGEVGALGEVDIGAAHARDAPQDDPPRRRLRRRRHLGSQSGGGSCGELSLGLGL